MAECCPQKLLVRLLSVEFKQDHDMLKDAWDGADGHPEWHDTGKLYTPPDWASNMLAAGQDPNPVSYSMVQKLEPDRSNPVQKPTKPRGYAVADKANRTHMQVVVRLQITPDCGCPEKCQLYGEAQEYLSERKYLFQSGWIILAPAAERSITLFEDPFVPVRVSLLDLKIDWYLKSHPSAAQQYWPEKFNFDSTRNRRYVTFGKPILDSDPRFQRERGVTLRRMDESVEWVSHASTNDHPYIISHLFGHFHAYTLVELRRIGSSYELGYSNLSQRERTELKDNPALLKRLGDADWSTYFTDNQGSWPAADRDLVKFGAECQAICRLVVGMMRQLGSTADFKLVYATADFSKPEQAIIDGHTGNRPTGPDSSKHYILVDSAVEVGMKYIAPVLIEGEMKIPPGNYRDTNSVGWNNFEAYLLYRYKEGGKTKERWYGGGIGEHKGNPIHVFVAIVEYKSGSEVIKGQLVQYFLVTRVHEYPNEESSDDDEESSDDDE